MRGNQVVRRLRWLILLLPFTAAIAQPPPPPPPPTPLAPPPQPPGNLVTTAKANLGKALFWDEQMSSTHTVACGSCHQAGTGGSDARSIFGSSRAANPGADQIAGTPDDVLGSPGVPLNQADGSYAWSPLYGFREQVTGRLAPSYINAAYVPELFWDGRAGRTFVDPTSGDTLLPNGGALENQALAPPVSSAEMGHLGRDWNEVAAQIATAQPLSLAPFVPADLAAWIGERDYPALFAEAFGSPVVTPARIAMAIASYERTQFSNQTPFDSALAGQAPLTPQEQAGRQLFGALPCAGCHGGSLLSDNLFHYIGVRPAAEDSGRAVVTHNPADVGAFKTPSLRNVSLRRAFMHDGRFGTLADVLAFYNRGGDFNAPNKAPAIRPLGLDPGQLAQLEAFLRRPLTDPRVARSEAPFDRPTLYGESTLVPEIVGAGVSGAGGVPQPVALEPPFAGNDNFTLGVFGASGGADAVLVIDGDEPPADGGIPAAPSFARVAMVLGGAGAAGGFGSASIDLPDDPSMYGATLYARWYVADAGAPGGVAASPAIRFQIFGAHGAGALQLVVGPKSTPASGTLRLYAGQPNPFRSSSIIRFDLLEASDVRLGVFDAQGRAVRRLLSGAHRMPGSYSLVWDGRDDRGREAPAGIYFYRLENGNTARSARVARIE